MSNYEMNCDHLSSTSVRLAGDPMPSAWECDECGHLRPFTDADYEFHASKWMPPRVPSNPFAGYEARRAYLLARA